MDIKELKRKERITKKFEAENLAQYTRTKTLQYLKIKLRKKMQSFFIIAKVNFSLFEKFM